jgi:hypothetical protein
MILQGGPLDGKVIDNWPTQGAFVVFPVLWPPPSRPTERGMVIEKLVFEQQWYHQTTGIYHKGKMPTDRPALPWSFTLFGPHIERLLAWADNRRRYR